MADREAAKFAGGVPGRNFGVADHSFHLPGQRVGQGVQVFLFSLGDHFDASVGKVTDVTGDRVMARQVLRGVSKSNTLHVAAE